MTLLTAIGALNVSGELGLAEYSLTEGMSYVRFLSQRDKMGTSQMP